MYKTVDVVVKTYVDKVWVKSSFSVEVKLHENETYSELTDRIKKMIINEIAKHFVIEINSENYLRLQDR